MANKQGKLNRQKNWYAAKGELKASKKAKAERAQVVAEYDANYKAAALKRQSAQSPLAD